jgi:hypothetical protein
MKSPFSKSRDLGMRPRVGTERRSVGRSRHLVLGLWALACALTGCATSPEQLLIGSWREVDWRYETLSAFERESFTDTSLDHSGNGMERHEGEHWEFMPGGKLKISRRGHEQRTARWQLKGRGHLLQLRSGSATEGEVYEIEELRGDRLVLHYDIGMEVRGIARLRFERKTALGSGFASR